MAGRDDDKDKTVFGGPPQGKPRGTTDIWSRGPQGQGGDDGRTMIGRPGQAGSPFGGDQHTASPFGQPQGGGDGSTWIGGPARPAQAQPGYGQQGSGQPPGGYGQAPSGSPWPG